MLIDISFLFVCYSFVLNYSPPSGHEVASPCGFDLHFPNDQ